MKARVFHEELRTPSGSASPSVQNSASSGGTNNNTGTRTTAVQASSQSTIKGEYSKKSDYENRAEHSGKVAAYTKQDITTYINALNKGLNSYKNLVGIVFSGKANAVVQISKNYMDLIRSHVNDYVGQSDNTADNTVQRPGTNYPKPEQTTNNQNKK